MAKDVLNSVKLGRRLMSNKKKSFADVLVTVVGTIAGAPSIGWRQNLSSATAKAKRTD
jgi:hypothetical protein